MPLVSQKIPSYKGGVSQQSILLRFPDQVSEQINGVSDEVQGLRKRKPLAFESILAGFEANSDLYHFIDRDSTEQYLLNIKNGDIKVYDILAKKSVVVNDPHQIRDNGYLTATNSKGEVELKALTIADYTFLLNKNVKPKMTSKKSPDGFSNQTLLYVKNAQYAKTYAIFEGSKFLAGVITPDGGAPKQAVQTTTAYIAKQLLLLLQNKLQPNYTTYEQLLDLIGGTGTMYTARAPDFDFNKYTWSLNGDSVIVCEGKGSERPKLGTKDGYGGLNFITIEGQVNNTSKLPPTAPEGYIIRVTGVKGDEDDYYIRWTGTIWKECPAPNLNVEIDPATMPLTLTREEDGTFKVGTVAWSEREVGDEDTNETPSFIGRPIKDIFYFRNRLGFLCDENIVLSASADFFNFWFKSATTLLDTDVVDVAVSSPKVSLLTNAVAMGKELMLFSKEGQFVLGADGVLSPKSVKVDTLTAFNYSSKIDPISLGHNIFFLNNRTKYSSLMRYYTMMDASEQKNAEDVSLHIPAYIEHFDNDTHRSLVGSTTYNTVLLSNSDSNEVYVYRYLYDNGQAIQQAWSKWSFNINTKVLKLGFIDTKCYFVNLVGDKVLLCSIDFGDKETYFDLTNPYLDYIIDVDGNSPFVVYDEYANESTINLRYAYPYWIPPIDTETTFYLVALGKAVKITYDDIKDYKVVLRGDWRVPAMKFGISYEFRVDVSAPTVKVPYKNTEVSEDSGRLQLRNYWVNYEYSGPIYVDVSDFRRNTKRTYCNTGKILSLRPTILGQLNPYGERYRVPVHCQTKDVRISIYSDAPTPLNITSGGWDGFYTRRTQPI